MFYVNDAHTKLTRTQVAAVRQIHSIDELCRAITEAERDHCQISVFGGRHSLGRQAFRTASVCLDLSKFNQVLDFDGASGILRIQGGCRWPDIRAFLAKQVDSSGRVWEIHQKQTGVDSISIAGSIAVNAHGNVLRSGPISHDVAWLKLVGPDGVEVHCDRHTNSELFELVVGGMGLFGIISEIGLQLVPQQRFLRHSSVRQALEVIELWSEQEHPYEYGDMQLNMDPNSGGFLHYGIANLREPVSADRQLSRSVVPADWGQLLALAHFDKGKAFECYSAYAAQVDGCEETRDDFLWNFYRENYHEALAAQFGLPPSGDVMAEFFIPASHAAQLLQVARTEARRLKVDIVLATLRAIEACDTSFLRWAKQNYICLVMAMHTEHTTTALASTDEFCGSLCEFCSLHDGSFYLPYRPFASSKQLQAAYPEIDDFVSKKREYDPSGRFASDWYEAIKFGIYARQPTASLVPRT